MEQNLEQILDDVHNVDNVEGCILADNNGLCLGAKGYASSDSAGLITAVMDLVVKLEPKSEIPIVSLQNDNRQCIIHRKEAVVAAIYKNKSI
ncbi:ragulator complex protein LAMTOR5 [Linepithema humile]|uniref:ragulator complex protein LAMTOR5 n=1 Tax=Linepithema humile TaxID=83485 RepID=UPI0006230EE4|nr:PREDICTED: ragulator complex protein LAMTOR5 homolog [Linepithema humile]